MAKTKSQCPHCLLPTVPLLLSDVIGEEIENESKDWIASLKMVFKHFSLVVCPKCGYTTLYVNRDARMRAAR
jgi:predicted nucleic-acid-binding Zn-ribbon protein